MDLAPAPKLGGHVTLWMVSWSDRAGVLTIREQAAGVIVVGLLQLAALEPANSTFARCFKARCGR
jgi:hypothetical protein